ncbi:MAG: SpoIIE family protein phosphatase [Planctomycetota bacterium]
MSALAVAVLAIGAFVVVALMVRNQDRIADAQTRRFLSYQLADEVRQSSDDLTRMARTYVVTGDPRFEEYFNRILEIREGRAPRPVGYHGVYWDFVTATGQSPRPDGEPIALESLMREYGFSRGEFALLDRAKNLSDDLVVLEERAMHAVKGLFPDSTGAFSMRGEPDLTLARNLLHGPEYHKAKAAIMAPVDEFVSRVDARTAEEIAGLHRYGSRLGLIARVILGVGILLLVVSPVLLRRAEGASTLDAAPRDAKAAGTRPALAMRSAWPLLMAASVAVLGIILLAWWNQARIEDQMRTDTENALTTVLNATTGSVKQWFREREQEAQVWAGHLEVREYSQTLAEVEAGLQAADVAVARAGLRAQLDEFALGMGYQGYMVLSPGGTVLASHDPAQIPAGASDVVREEFLSDVMSAPRFGAIELPHLLSLQSDERSEPTMLIGAAIKDEGGGVVAALVLLLDPQETFTRILQRGRIGLSGESYAFNRDGQLISESRFDDQLRGIGLISDTERAILNIEIRDPGGNLTEGFRPTPARSEQPLTLMADQAITKGPGANLDGYNDYRGVSVVGAWTWDETDGIGITTEMDVAEAFRSVRRMRRSSILASGASVLLVLALAGLFLRNRVRMAEAHSELESVVGHLRDANEELESVNSVILRWSPEGTVTFLNDFGLRLFGFSRDEIIGKPVLGTIVADQESTGRSLTTMIGEILERPEKYESNENENITRDGDRVWMAWRNKPIANEDGTLKEILTVGIDITDRIRAEKILNRQSTALKAAVDGIAITDTEGVLVWVNPAFSALTGYSREEVIGQSPRVLKSGVHDAAFYEHMWQAIAAGRVWNGEVINKRKDGSLYTEEMSITPVRDAEGEIVNFVAIKRDITERKRMEEELEKARQRMEDELNLGREIQMSMLPLTFPPFIGRDEFTIYAQLIPAREVGGDFYDFFFIDDEHLCMCVGDVSGKGVPSALFMAVTRTLIKSAAADDPSPASILTRANTELSDRNESCMFVTIFVGILNVKTGRIRYTNAGHNPPYLKHADGSISAVNKRHGPVIGGMPGLTYAEDELVLASGDLLVMYTDGVTEAMSPAEDLYTEKRLSRLIGDQALATVEDAVGVIVADVDVHAAGAEQSDDITVLAVRFQGPDTEVTGSFDLSVPNQLSSIDAVNTRFNDFADDFGVPADMRRRINMVFDELLNNVISYAFEDENEHEIEVRVSLERQRLVIEILDDGRPFNPFAQATPDTTLPLEARRVGGLGIHLVQKVMDEVSYERRIDKNLVKLVKSIETS